MPRTRFALGLAALIVSSAACAGGSDPNTNDGSEPTPASAYAEIPELAANVRPSVVSIQTEIAQGSGVIWSASGIVITNHHVVDGGSEVAVLFADGERFPATVLASDRRSDLAAVKVDREGLPAATFSADIPPVGALALAVGNPLGFENTVTLGIVSGLHRAVPQSPVLVDLIQTDAPISPGNSGGALVGATGEVIGINVAYIPPQARAVSIGFAIPSPTVIDVVEQLLATGSVEHPYIGVRVTTLSPAIAAEFGLELGDGVLVLEVEPDSPAEAAGLTRGDVITHLAGQRQRDVGRLLTTLRGLDPGDEAEVEFVHAGDRRHATIVIGTIPDR